MYKMMVGFYSFILLVLTVLLINGIVAALTFNMALNALLYGFILMVIIILFVIMIKLWRE